MKAEELMIGDWVFLDGVPSRVGLIEANPQTVYVKNERLGIRVDMEDVDPIPLTSEILEQNGWGKVPQPGCANPYHWQLEKYEEETDGLLYRIKAYETFFRGMYVTIDNPSDCEPVKFTKQLEYVHQFQHILRLCGIEKEIIVKN